MKIQRLLYSKFSSIIISFILGLGLATLFRQECDSGKCYMYYAPNELKDTENIYKYDNNCYKLNSSAMKCNKDKTLITFA